MQATVFLGSLRVAITGAVLFALALATGCATGPDIRSDFDQNADFRSYKTFGFIDPLGTDKHGYSSLVTSHFKSAARQEMQALGYNYSENDPELLVNFFMSTENRTDIRSRPRLTATYSYYGYRSGLYIGFPVYESGRQTHHYKMGTLNIDVVDADKERLIWEGIAEGKLSREALDNPRPAIHSAVKQIFQHYPTAPKAIE